MSTQESQNNSVNIEEVDEEVLPHQQTTDDNPGFIATFKNFDKKQRKIFLALFLLSVNDAIGFTCIAPFFSVVASSKGLSELYIGLIFSAYSAAGLFAAYIIGSKVGVLGAKFCVVSGMLWSFVSILCFGFIFKTSPTTFFILSIICRMYMGFGINASYTAMFAIIFHEFGNRSITVISMSEGLIIIGSMLGPIIGGGLYKVGGYPLPFIILGSIQAILTLLCYIFLPSYRIEKFGASVSPVYLLLSPSGTFCFLVVSLCFMMSSFTVAFVPKFLDEEFQMDSLSIGIFSVVGAICYSLFSPFWGYICDRWPKFYCMEFGFIFMACGFAVFGPAAFLKRLFGWEKQKRWLVYLAQILSSSFYGAVLVQTFQLSQNAYK